MMVMPAAAFPVLMFVFVLMLAFIVVVVTAMAVPVFVLVHVSPPIKSPRAYDPRAVSY